MKGVVFNVLEQLVVDQHGEDEWDDLLADAGLTGAYTSLGNYDHREFEAIVAAAGRRWGERPDDVVRWCGRHAIPIFARRYPQLFAPHSDTRAFALTLNAIIHPEVLKLYPGAAVPVFDFDTSDPDVLELAYASERGLCAFAEGLLEGAAAHYGERASIEQPECVHRGGERCVLRVVFGP